MPLHSYNNLLVETPLSSKLPFLPSTDFSGFEALGALYKHCKSIHLPSQGRAIRLGTLSEYRINENRFVNDSGEGTAEVILSFPNETYASIDWLDRVTFGTFPKQVGDFRGNLGVKVLHGSNTLGPLYSTEDLTIESIEGGEARIRGTINLFFEGADAFVLCLSTKREAGSVILDPDYNSVWSVRRGLVLEFVKAITRSLHSSLQNSSLLRAETLGPLNAPAFSMPPRGEGFYETISVEIWRVNYRDRKIEIQMCDDSVIGIVSAMLNESSYSKPVQFSSEAEVRIIFRPAVVNPSRGEKYLFPNYLVPVLLPFDELLEFTDVEVNG